MVDYRVSSHLRDYEPVSTVCRFPQHNDQDLCISNVSLAYLFGAEGLQPD